MKKSLLIIGLFSLMMVLTSFTVPNETGGKEGASGGVKTTGTDYSSETGGKEGASGGVKTTGTDYSSETGGKEGASGGVKTTGTD